MSMSSTRSFLKDRPCLFECKREKQRSETGKDFVPLFSSGTVRGLASLGNDRRLHSLKKRLVVEKTGDLGRIDADGYLYVLDRRSDLIISGGENVYPAEVEAALLSISGITEAGVVGRFDPIWGQVPVAFIVSTMPETGIREEMGRLLAKYKCPVTYFYRDTLPRNANGKLIRRQLKESL